MPDPTEQLADWQAKTDAATPESWVANRTAYGVTVEEDATEEMIFVETYGITWTPNPADAEFIAMSRTAMPKLLAAIQEIREIRPWPSNSNMQPYEIDEAQGYNEAMTEVRRVIAAALGGSEPSEEGTGR